VDRLRVLPDADAVLHALRAPRAQGIDGVRESVAVRADVGELALPAGARASAAAVFGAEGNRLDVRAEGPGLLVVAESWDAGWSARLDGSDTPVFRVEHARMGVVLPEGIHRVELTHWPSGLVAGIVLALVGALLLGMARI
jgi:hypothetical protein